MDYGARTKYDAKTVIELLASKNPGFPVMLEVHIKGEIAHTNISEIEFKTCSGWVIHTEEINKIG